MFCRAVIIFAAIFSATIESRKTSRLTSRGFLGSRYGSGQDAVSAARLLSVVRLGAGGAGRSPDTERAVDAGCGNDECCPQDSGGADSSCGAAGVPDGGHDVVVAGEAVRQPRPGSAVQDVVGCLDVREPRAGVDCTARWSDAAVREVCAGCEHDCGAYRRAVGHAVP